MPTRSTRGLEWPDFSWASKTSAATSSRYAACLDLIASCEVLISAIFDSSTRSMIAITRARERPVLRMIRATDQLRWSRYSTFSSSVQACAGSASVMGVANRSTTWTSSPMETTSPALVP